jgi:branched-chain amino acid transport system substrate-binding protein
MIRKILFSGVVVAMVLTLLPYAGIAAEMVKIGIVCELSGSGAPAGMRWQRGILMAVDEINAAGGILGRQIETFSLDSKTEPPVSVAAMKKAIEKDPYVVMGTVYSSSTVVNMHVLEKAGIPQFTGSTAPPITQKGNQNIFRTDFSSALVTQKMVKWLSESLGVKKMAWVYANDAMGKGLRDSLGPPLTKEGIKLVADITTEVGQADFTGELARVKTSGADTFFVHLHEEESGRILPQVRELGLGKSMKIVGVETLVTEDTLRLAGDAANGVQSHIGLSPVTSEFKPIADRYIKKYNEVPDHNFFKAYMGMQIVKAITEEIGTFDRQKLRDTLHNHTLCLKDHPGIVMDVRYDENGDIDKKSFLVKVENKKHVITGVVPPLHEELFEKCK